MVVAPVMPLIQGHDLWQIGGEANAFLVIGGATEIMTLDEWHHRHYSHYVNGPDNKLMGNAPCSYETFPLIAEVLATGDSSRFRPTLPPNTYWSNWPDAGSL